MRSMEIHFPSTARRVARLGKYQRGEKDRDGVGKVRRSLRAKRKLAMDILDMQLSAVSLLLL